MAHNPLIAWAGRLVLTLFLVLPLGAQQKGKLATITHRNTPVKAGPRIPDAQLRKAGPGELVEFFGYKGEFAEVAQPGGVQAFILEKRKGRVFVEVNDKLAQGRVVVDRLSLRPFANLDWPAMGFLRANESVRVLERLDGNWLRVLAPKRTHVYVHRNYLRLRPDQEKAAAEFMALDQARRQEFLAAGRMSAPVLKDIQMADALEKRYLDLQERMDAALAGSPNLETLASLRQEFSALQKEAPEDSKVARAAGEKVAYLKGKEDTVRRFAEADARIRRLEEERKRREREYQKNLNRYRNDKKEKMARADKPKSRFLRLGIGRLHKVFIGSGRIPTWVLSKGAENRYYVTSERYDLSEYVDKKIGITRWKLEPPANGGKLERVEVLRLEILDD